MVPCYAAEATDAFDQYSHMSARLEEQQEMTRAAEKLATEVSVVRGRGVDVSVCGCWCIMWDLRKLGHFHSSLSQHEEDLVISPSYLARLVTTGNHSVPIL